MCKQGSKPGSNNNQRIKEWLTYDHSKVKGVLTLYYMLHCITLNCPPYRWHQLMSTIANNYRKKNKIQQGKILKTKDSWFCVPLHEMQVCVCMCVFSFSKWAKLQWCQFKPSFHPAAMKKIMHFLVLGLALRVEALNLLNMHAIKRVSNIVEGYRTVKK